MKRRAAILAAALVGLLCAGPASADPGGSLAVSDVHTVNGQLTFTVTGDDLPAGTTLDGLTVDVNGTPLAATVVPAPAASPSPVPDGSVVLVMDTSGSMAGTRLTAARGAADGYADGLPPAVRLGLVAVSDKPASVLAPTADRAAFHTAVAGLRAGGGTALYDGVRQAADLLGGTAAGQRRIVVLSDGADTSSKANPAQVATALAGAGASLDVIGYGPDADSRAVRDLATGSGGRVVAAADAQALRGAFARMVATAPAPPSATVRVPAPAWLAGSTATLNVALGAVRAAPTGVNLPAAAGPARAAAPVPPRWPLTLALVAIGLAGLLGGGVVMYIAAGRSGVRGRLRQLERFGAAAATPAREGGPAGSALRAAVSGAESMIARRGNVERIETDLDRAGMNLRASEWIMVRLGVTFLAALLLAVLLPWLVGLILGGLAGWFGTGGYRRFRAARRSRRFNDQLPEALQLVVSALRSGFAFPQAIAAIAQEGDAAVSGEFGRALAETRVGGDLEDALLRVAERTASTDLEWLVMAIRVQREVGGALSEVLETAVETMRERARLRRHVRALSAEGRLSAYVLGGMPIALGGFMFLARREYLRPLYTTPLGIIMLISAVLMMGMGILWLSRMIRVEV